MTFTEKIIAAKRLTERAKKIKPSFWIRIFNPSLYKRKKEIHLALLTQLVVLKMEMIKDTFSFGNYVAHKVKAQQLETAKNFPSGGVPSKEGCEYKVPIIGEIRMVIDSKSDEMLKEYYKVENAKQN